MIEQNSFHQKIPYSKENKLRDFHRVLKNGSCRKSKPNIITVRNTVKLCILSSVATLEAHKSESEVSGNKLL